MVDKIIQRSWYSPGCGQLHEIETDVSNHFFFFLRLRGKFQRDSELFFSLSHSLSLSYLLPLRMLSLHVQNSRNTALERYESWQVEICNFKGKRTACANFVVASC